MITVHHFQNSTRPLPNQRIFALGSFDKKRMISLFVVCVLHSRLWQALAESCFPPSELAALQDFYNSLDGDNWRWNFSAPISFDDGLWNSSASLSFDDDMLEDFFEYSEGVRWNFTGYHNPCLENWHGINCTFSNVTFLERNISVMSISTMDMSPVTINCSVISIDLTDFNLTGQLPHSLSNFTNLEVLHLPLNNIYGSIPESLGNMSRLVFLSLAYNNLSSGISNSLGNCTSLMRLHLENNHFSGTIPDSFFSLSNLIYLNLEYNSLEGVLNPLFGRLVNLKYLNLGSNRFHDQIPLNFSSCSMLTDFYVDSNDFTGPFPEAFRNLSLIHYIDLYSNGFSGPIPEWLGLTHHLLNLDLGHNKFSGTFPESLCLMNRSLSRLLVNDNKLHGRLPSCFGGNESVMADFVMCQNQFTGTLPVEYETNRLLKSFLTSSNDLHGTLPHFQCPVMQALYVQNNRLSGNLDHVFNATVQKLMEYVDFSSNEFTGTIPDIFYEMPLMQSIAMVSNCLTGSISDKVCNLEVLEYLDLDGMYTADACQKRILPLFDSYVMGTNIKGHIPPCLFSLPKIQSIHISGNSIDCTLPNDLEISESVTDITLSHNMLKGVIPITMQTRRFTTLDLSYNCFSGGLHPDFNVSDETRVQVNRLSGAVPSVFRHAHNIKILSGNLFECDVTRGTLPLNDPEYSNYQCGSNEFDEAMVLWALAFLPVLLALLGVEWAKKYQTVKFAHLRKQFLELSEYWQTCFHIYSPDPKLSEHDQSHLVEFDVYLTRLRATFVRLTLAICLFFLPLYLMLSTSFSTHSHEYAWSVSALFLSGEEPALVLMMVYIGLLAVILVSLRGFLWRWLRKEIYVEHETRSRTQLTQISFSTKRFLLLFLVAVVNCGVMLTLNGVYVYFVFEASTLVVFFCQVMISLFKIMWNEYALTRMVHELKMRTKSEIRKRPVSIRSASIDGGRPLSIHRSASIDTESGVDRISGMSTDSMLESDELRRVEDAEGMPILTFIILFNSIIAPVIANAILSQQCFQRVFIPPDSITSNGAYAVCQQKHSLELTNVACLTQTERDLTTSYDPPFIYRYQCSSSFINHYASVYVYTFLLTAFGKPVGLAAMKYVYDVAKDVRLKKFASKFLNRLMREDQYDQSKLKRMRFLFRKERFVLNNVSATCVLLTVGVVFPPVAAIVVVAIISHTYMNQFMIGRFATCFKDEDKELVLNRLSEDCEGVPVLFKYSLLIMIPFISCFYAFYVLDIYGDATNWKEAMWAAIVVFVMPMFGYPIYLLYRLLLGVWHRRVERTAVAKKMWESREKTKEEMKRPSYYLRSTFVANAKTVADVTTVHVENPIRRAVEMTSR